MNEADFIWMNGEIVPWKDAKIHVLSHGLHYGSGVFEGIRAYETERGTAVFRHREHLDRLKLSGELYHMELPFSVDQIRDATHELIRRNKLRQALHPADRVPRLRRDGPVPAERSRRLGDCGLALGRLPRRRGAAERDPLQGRLLAAHVTRQLHPSGEGLGPVPQNASWPRSRAPRPATTRRSSSTTTATSQRARARTFMVSDGEKLVMPPLSASALDGITARSWSRRSPRTSASR